jgi:hypothetical protein
MTTAASGPGSGAYRDAVWRLKQKVRNTVSSVPDFLLQLRGQDLNL